jgi:hypothetical protein
MNTLAWMVGRLSTGSARLMLRWAETKYGSHAVRLWLFCNVLDRSDEPALVGVAGKRRGHHITAPGTSERYDCWRHSVAWWTCNRLAERAHIVIDSWKPAIPAERPQHQSSAERLSA